MSLALLVGYVFPFEILAALLGIGLLAAFLLKERE
jgi:NADH:ubiquinone oxidoreductase subunit 6 (subunit J)